MPALLGSAACLESTGLEFVEDGLSLPLLLLVLLVLPFEYDVSSAVSWRPRANSASSDEDEHDGIPLVSADCGDVAII